MELIECKACKSQISPGHEFCPYCGAKDSEHADQRPMEDEPRNVESDQAKKTKPILKWLLFAVIGVVMFQIFFTGDSSEPTPVVPTVSQPRVHNAEFADTADIEQAEKLLRELPSACRRSSAQASADGTVRIHIICRGNGQSTDGLIAIRGGVVTDIR